MPKAENVLAYLLATTQAKTSPLLKSPLHIDIKADGGHVVVSNSTETVLCITAAPYEVTAEVLTTTLNNLTPLLECAQGLNWLLSSGLLPTNNPEHSERIAELQGYINQLKGTESEFRFTVELVGTGTTYDDAWRNATEEFYNDPGAPGDVFIVPE